jgi:hypothetical protein
MENRGRTRGFAMSVRVLTTNHTFSRSKFKTTLTNQIKNFTKPLNFGTGQTKTTPKPQLSKSKKQINLKRFKRVINKTPY